MDTASSLVKKAVLFSLTVFWAVVLFVFVMGLPQQEESAAPSPPQGQQETQSQASRQQPVAAEKASRKNSSQETGASQDQHIPSAPARGDLLSWREVQRHQSAGDCWIVVDGGVYDVTSYLVLHPGGAAIMLSYCGKDASAAFHSKGKRKPKDHSPKAYQQLARYYLGPLGGKRIH